MKLLIVESPAKAKTLKKYLDKEFIIISSYGHIRSLPSVKGAVLPGDDGFKILYQPLSRSKETIRNLMENFKISKEIYLATDPDREGEAIAWHILEMMKQEQCLKEKSSIKRIVFYEITKDAVIKAINNPRSLDQNLIDAQKTRQALDYLVGFTLSPILWIKLPGCKSAGRVQSVGLKLLCQRENERDKFSKEEYWTITSLFSSCNTETVINSQLISYQGEKLKRLDIFESTQAQVMIKNLRSLEYTVSSIKRKKIIKKPLPPFTTSTLIQDAWTKLNFTAKKTMMVAQKLYEGVQVGDDVEGLITYMRTDSLNISQEAIEKIISFIEKSYTKKYLPNFPILYKSKSKISQEAHEAIRPTNFLNTPSNIKNFLDEDQWKLYDLIWRRTIASQMAGTMVESVNVEISSRDQLNTFSSTKSQILFDGFYKIYKEDKENEKVNDLLFLKEKDVLEIQEITPDCHFTQPPARYTEATFVKKMEETGIGRPSTYPKIISTLVERGYAKISNGKFIPEIKGRLVDAFLNEFFHQYVDYEFTANLEYHLDKIANGKSRWKEVLSNFWVDFNNQSKKVSEIRISDVVNSIDKLLTPYIFPSTDNLSYEEKKRCKECQNGTLGLRTSKFGAFIGCSNYPKCKYKRNLLQEENTDDKKDSKLLGVDKNTKSEVFLKKGPYGFYLEQNINNSPKRVSLPPNILPNNISLELGQELLSLPKNLGTHPTQRKNIFLKKGRYGLYLECDKIFYSLKNIEDLNMSLGDSIKLIDSKIQADKKI